MTSTPKMQGLYNGTHIIVFLYISKYHENFKHPLLLEYTLIKYIFTYKNKPELKYKLSFNNLFHKSLKYRNT